jgi:hypothetical protein
MRVAEGDVGDWDGAAGGVGRAGEFRLGVGDGDGLASVSAEPPMWRKTSMRRCRKSDILRRRRRRGRR